MNSYKIEDWKLGQEEKREKEAIGQELKRLMLARKNDEQVSKGRMKSMNHQEVGRRGMQDDELSKPSKEAKNRELELVSQHVNLDENIYFVELASDEDEDKAAEEQAEWEAQLAKKLELKLSLKRKRENWQVLMFTYKDRKKEQEDKEHKKMKNGNTTVDTGEFVDDNGLIDIDLKGSKYTWFSNPKNNVITRKRLDRVLVNWKWLQIYQNVNLRASPAITSDHCALILDTQRQIRIKKDFRFEAYWAEHEECKEVIKRS
ncbi:hypothetical protein Ahy_B05g075110 [Arachis hypogaea]|uniref:Endonuclease/exonuclease/phosphatase domain-containing protein n=1 Tax=Arachis hypogaea TaxID=3818 RepID=A0A444Z0I0_ARAHY|nr:hypothetical protein Ahy_B05g075110 [Arachis hypogaea]